MVEERADSPPELGGVAAPSIKWREATELGADGVVPLERPASNSFGTTPPARPFLEFDGLAGTPPNSGGEFQTRDCQLVHTFSCVATFCCRSAALIGCASRDILDSTVVDRRYNSIFGFHRASSLDLPFPPPYTTRLS